MKVTVRDAWRLTKCAFNNWMDDAAATTGASLAFYCAFSLAPLLVILVTIAGWITNEQAAYGHLSAQLTALFGKNTADVLLEAMEKSQSGSGGLAALISIGTLLLGATTVFAALRDALEHIWRSEALAPTGLGGWLRSRILSFGMILAFGFLLLVSLSLSTAISALKSSIGGFLSGIVAVAGVIDLLVSLLLVTGLIALIYRYMPSRRMSWKPVLWGAVATALLFHIGRWLIGLYLGRATQPSAFGAAASFAAMLLWLYYSAQIFLLGAEFTACLGGVQRQAAENTGQPLPTLARAG